MRHPFTDNNPVVCETFGYLGYTVITRQELVPKVTLLHVQEQSFRDSVFPLSSRARSDSSVFPDPRGVDQAVFQVQEQVLVTGTVVRRTVSKVGVIANRLARAGEAKPAGSRMPDGVQGRLLTGS